jgi:hypothetical protein
MILPDFILPSRANARWEYSGIDSIDRCLNKKHFKNYPYKVEYVYNSRGFRDSEWPESTEELKNALWCIGDSFTVGIGTPLEHTWPYLLQQKTGRRCINISLDGASNDWIARKTQSIINEISPSNIVIMWSYFHRRENKDTSLTDEKRRLPGRPDTLYQDLQNYKMCINLVQQAALENRVNIRHTAIHKQIFLKPIDIIHKTYDKIRDPGWPDINNHNDLLNLPTYILDEIKTVHQVYDYLTEIFSTIELMDYCETLNVIEVPQLDWARDHHHVDILSNKWFVEQLNDIA